MRRNFIILFGSEDPADVKRLIGHFHDSKFNYWHWIVNSWLIVDYEGKFTCEQLRNQLKVMFPTTVTLVIEILGDVSWYGNGPQSPELDMFKWLHEHFTNLDGKFKLPPDIGYMNA